MSDETVLDRVHAVAAEYRRELSDDEAGHVLWNYTGYPSFWTGDPAECLTAQLHTFFNYLSTGHVPCARCGGRSVDGLCASCDAEIERESVAAGAGLHPGGPE